MIRSRLIIDRSVVKIRPKNKPNEPKDDAGAIQSNEEPSKSSKGKAMDSNTNNNSNRNTNKNNFDFIVPCDIGDEIDSLDSLEIKNWRYHLTTNRL